MPTTLSCVKPSRNQTFATTSSKSLTTLALSPKNSLKKETVRSFYRAKRCRSERNVMKAVLSMWHSGRRNDSASPYFSRSKCGHVWCARSTSRFTSSQKIMAQSETELCGAFERPWRERRTLSRNWRSRSPPARSVAIRPSD